MPNSTEARQDRAARLAADPSIRPHGDLNTYSNWGCTCERCKAAYRKYLRERTPKEFDDDRADRMEEARRRGWDVTDDVI